MEPTPDQVERGAGVLGYFVTPWHLPVNPEELHEMAYAVLVHHDSSASWDEIGAAVEAQIAEHRRKAAELDAMYRGEHGAQDFPAGGR